MLSTGWWTCSCPRRGAGALPGMVVGASLDDEHAVGTTETAARCLAQIGADLDGALGCLVSFDLNILSNLDLYS